jgi:hypothetical protein
MRTMAALQLLAAFFVAILGLALAFRAGDGGAMLLGAFLGALGLSFITLFVFNIKKRT